MEPPLPTGTVRLSVGTGQRPDRTAAGQQTADSGQRAVITGEETAGDSDTAVTRDRLASIHESERGLAQKQISEPKILQQYCLNGIRPIY